MEKYSYLIAWDATEEQFLAKCLEFPSLSTYGLSPQDALREIEDVVKCCADDLKAEKKSEQGA